MRAMPIKLLLLAFWLTSPLAAWQRVVGANASGALNPSAAVAGVGGADLVLARDVLGLNRNALVVLSDPHPWLAAGHNALFEGSQLQAVALSLPLKEQSVGVALSRFGTSGIIWLPEGAEVPATMPTQTISIADWSLSLAWARSFWGQRLDVGATTQLLWRDLDQQGLGFSSDVVARWHINSQWAVVGRAENWFGSLATWESGYQEFSPPKVVVGTEMRQEISYLYGELRLGWQSADLLHRRNQDLYWEDYIKNDSTAAGVSSGGRIWETPWSWFKASALGAELRWHWGGAVRVGLVSLENFQGWTAGMGLQISERVLLDYAYNNHPLLDNLHRVSLALRLWKNSPSPVSEPKKQDLEAKTMAEPVTTEEIIDNNEEYLESGRVFWEE